jgi:hypothetical protein
MRLVQVAVDDFYYLAVTVQGRVVAFDDIHVPAELGDVVHVAVNEHHALAVTRQG